MPVTDELQLLHTPFSSDVVNAVGMLEWSQVFKAVPICNFIAARMLFVRVILPRSARVYAPAGRPSLRLNCAVYAQAFFNARLVNPSFNSATATAASVITTGANAEQENVLLSTASNAGGTEATSSVRSTASTGLPSSSPGSTNSSSVHLVAGVLAALFFLVGAALAVALWKARRRKSRMPDADVRLNASLRPRRSVGAGIGAVARDAWIDSGWGALLPKREDGSPDYSVYAELADRLTLSPTSAFIISEACGAPRSEHTATDRNDRAGVTSARPLKSVPLEDELCMPNSAQLKQVHPRARFS